MVRVKTSKLAATASKGVRIRVIGGGRHLTVPYPHSSTDPHKAAVHQWAETKLEGLEFARGNEVVVNTVGQNGDTGWLFDVHSRNAADPQ